MRRQNELGKGVVRTWERRQKEFGKRVRKDLGEKAK